MARGSFIESTASMVLTELLAPLRDDDGMALPSRYEVIFTFPPGDRGSKSADTNNIFHKILFGNVGAGGSRDVAMQCNAFEFPGRTLQSAPDSNMQGPSREIVNDVSFTEITGSFYCHTDMREKTMFETWQNLAYDPKHMTVGWYDSYVSNITIYNLDQEDNRRYGVELQECFPKTMTAQTVSADQATSVQTISVGFAFRNWINIENKMKAGYKGSSTLDRIQGVLANQVERKLLSSIPKVLRKLF